MKFEEAKLKFINNWGAFGSQWGINKTMAQIHALLLITPKPVTQDDIMEQLAISRGNVNMNVRDLMNWGLVQKVIISGERKEFYSAEKDIWKVAAIITAERKKRELDPMMKLLEELETAEGDAKNEDVKQFKQTIKSIKKLGAQADNVLTQVIKVEENFFFNTIRKIFV
jgi:DNA-binding transcriptional regulator GbsR (MarR family)